MANLNKKPSFISDNITSVRKKVKLAKLASTPMVYMKHTETFFTPLTYQAFGHSNLHRAKYNKPELGQHKSDHYSHSTGRHFSVLHLVQKLEANQNNN